MPTETLESISMLSVFHKDREIPFSIPLLIYDLHVLIVCIFLFSFLSLWFTLFCKFSFPFLISTLIPPALSFLYFLIYALTYGVS